MKTIQVNAKVYHLIAPCSKNVLQYKLPQRDKDHQSKVIKPVDDKYQKLYFQSGGAAKKKSGWAAEEAAGLPGSSFLLTGSAQVN